ncbi:MAG: pyridoxamine 5'-phosphate oxidase family protein [Corynebacterium sp.]|uniref:pyridoxamine 5'-phosphate oxidase family protein n=1 Tax=Corynebacterium sp. TaxID=1720 RepID=UPI0026DD4288|nr:pyridoxamine 5'-phosphate oxidase family protein [Corynebacterium sp.]MDO5030751.1 pyridoxamine 5'-phosphate oxidase family protein [Corynebacterium sp.]
MAYNDSVIQKLSTEESLELLASQTFGRLVVRRADDMDLFPLNYVVHEGQIYFRTAEGSKLFTVSLNHDVLFEGDNVDKDSQQAWSVIVKGDAEVLTSHTDVNKADQLPLKPWLPTLKYNYVRITPKEVSGRRFHLGEEPNRYEA